MPAGAVLAIIICCVLIALAAGAAAALELRRALARRQFGPEYDELAGRIGRRRARARADRAQAARCQDPASSPSRRARP